MNKGLFRKIAIVLIVLMNFGCDQISKEVVRTNVPPRDYIQLIGDKFILTNVENTGAMLGFGQQFPSWIKLILFQVLPIIVLLILLYRILNKEHLGRWSIFAFACVIGGGIGNLVDRIAYGSVTDFFQIQLGIFKTGIFNMADVSVTLGVILLLALSFSKEKSLF